MVEEAFNGLMESFTVVDFSKLRLPGNGSVPGEGTEPASGVEDGVSDSSSSASVSPTPREVDSLVNAPTPAVTVNPFARQSGAQTGASAQNHSSEAAESTDGEKQSEGAGLKLRLPSRPGSLASEGERPAVGNLVLPVEPSTVPEVVIVKPVEVTVETEEQEPVAPLILSEDAAAVGEEVSPPVSVEAVNPLLEDDDSFLDEFPEDDFSEDDSLLRDEEEAGESPVLKSPYSSAGAVNPLLEDDGDDELVSAASVAQQLGLHSGMTELADEDEPEDEREAFTGFDDQFQSLIEDDDEPRLVLPGRVSKPVGVPEVAEVNRPEPTREKPILEPLVEPPKWESVTVPAKHAKSAEELELEAAKRQGELREKEAIAKREKEFSSDFVGASTDVVKVDEEGQTKHERGRERNRLVKAGLGGKLKPRELDFFKSLSTIREEFSDGMITADLITGSLGRLESDEEKKGRIENLERTLDSRNLFRAGKSFKLDTKTVDTLTFLALFRYATHSHIARMFGEKPLTTLRRLRTMRGAGLVTSKKIYSQHAIWFLTEPGVIVSGYDMRHITEARLTPSMFPHQFTVNHVAANLMGGKLNVLNLDNFPVANRTNVKGEVVMGEQLTSELEILSSFAKIKLFEQSASFRPKMLALRDGEFARWRESPNRAQVLTPEMVFGNEWMFTLFPPLPVGIAYHVPDLVVKRQRAADGSPRSIAVEIEINNKPTASYMKTMRAYADDKLIFGQIIWVCKTVGPAKKLEKVGRDLGMIQTGQLKIVPIYTNEGVFKGRDLWTI